MWFSLITIALAKGHSVNREKREKVIADKLIMMGETLNSWASKNDLHLRIVTDLIDGTLKGTRGVPLENRRKMETVFGQIFDDWIPLRDVQGRGFLGLGRGATPVAIASMDAVLKEHGPSLKALLTVPLVGAFFIDLINAVTIETFIRFVL